MPESIITVAMNPNFRALFPLQRRCGFLWQRDVCFRRRLTAHGDEGCGVRDGILIVARPPDGADVHRIPPGGGAGRATKRFLTLPGPFLSWPGLLTSYTNPKRKRGLGLRFPSLALRTWRLCGKGLR